jgi:DNA-binding CsgD family transcriptional regulator
VLSAREREVPWLLAEDHSNAAIANELVISESAVEKPGANIFTSFDPVSRSDPRRVLAVLRLSSYDAVLG